MRDIRPPYTSSVPPSTTPNPLGQHHSWYWVVFLVVALIGLVLLLLTNYNFSQISYKDSANGAIAPSKEQLRLQIEFDVTRKRAFLTEARDGMVVEDALSRIAAYADLPFFIQNGEISMLGEESANGTHQWRVYINGNPAAAGLSHRVSAGDRIVLRYE